LSSSGGFESHPVEGAVISTDVLCLDRMPLFSSGVLRRRARVQSQVERSEPKGNLDGFLAGLHRLPQNEGQAASGTIGLAKKVAATMPDGWESG